MEPSRSVLVDADVVLNDIRDSSGAAGAVEIERIARAARRREVMLAAVIVGVARFAFSAHVDSFRITPDELANVGMARVLAGGQFNLLRSPTWQPGLPTLLAPLYALIEDPDWRLRVSIALNAVLAAVGFLLLLRLTTRLTLLRGRAAVVTAAAVAVTPAALVSSAHVWAEPLVTLCVLVHLLLVLRYWTARSVIGAVPLVLSAVAAYMVHTRLLPLVVSSVAIVVAGAVIDRRWFGILIAVPTAGAGVWATDWYSRWLIDRTWEEPFYGRTVGDVARRLTSPIALADATAGQIWYLLVTTGLVFGIGAVELVRRSVRRRDDAQRTMADDARLVLVTLLPLIGLSIVFMSDRARPDYFVYGRYNDAIMWPVLVVGVGWLLSGRHSDNARVRRWVIGGVAVVAAELALVTDQLHGGQLESGVPITDMIAGVAPFVDWLQPLNVLVVTGQFLVVAACVVGLALLWRSRPVLASVGLIGIVGAAGLASYASFRTQNMDDGWSTAREIADLPADVLPPGAILRVSLMPDVLEPAEPAILQSAYAMIYQWHLPDHRFVLDTPEQGSVRTNLLIAPINDSFMLEHDSVVLWRHPLTGMALWADARVPPLGGDAP